ncbi:acyltransferase-domain-containing protein, partial [Gorgonomyces haynaldii]
FFMQICTETRTYGKHHLTNALASGRPLITITNHDSTMDDPLLFGIMDADFFRSDQMRWTLCAQEICFTNWLANRFFSAAQGVPVVRGNGIHQPGMDKAVELLNKRQWVHLFPEARVNENPKEMLPFKWGVGRLVMESQEPPIVVPFYHTGMQQVLPLQDGWSWLRVGKQVDVVFGEPIDFAHPRYSKFMCRTSGLDEKQQRQAITSLLRSELLSLKESVEDLVTV